MKPRKLSPSALNLFVDCPRCFWEHQNEKVRRPSGPMSSLPMGMDKHLKNYFDSFRPNKVPPEIKETKAKLFSDMNLLNTWRNNFRGLQWTEPKSGIILMGAVDDMLEKDGKLIVLDFKTRGYALKQDTHLSYQKQIDIYTFLLQRNGHKTEKYGYLLFYHPDKIEDNGSVDFNVDLIKMEAKPSRGKKVFMDAVKCLSGEKPKSHSDCKFCEYKNGK